MAKCLNCDKEAKKAGMCIACYTKHNRATGPVTMAARQRRYPKERRKLTRELLDLIHRVESLEEQSCFLQDAALVNRFKEMVSAVLEERLNEKPVRLEVVPPPKNA
jgi:hypothetical protein